MIQLTRLNGKQFVLNAEQIRCIEASSDQDTTITLLDGEHLAVREPVAEVVRRAIDYLRTIRTFRG